MKILYQSICIFLLFTSSVTAQDYQCVHEGRTALFFKENDYISALKIDSIAVDNSDSVYYKKGDTEWGTPLIITSVEPANKYVPGIKIYPNPAKDILNIDLEFMRENLGYKIFNLLGEKTILSGNITTDSQSIDISQLPDGIYLLHLMDQTFPFIKTETP